MTSVPTWQSEVARRLERPGGVVQFLSAGANKEVWAFSGDGPPLVVRRVSGSRIHHDELDADEEFELLAAMLEAGVHVPRPVANLGEIEGRLTTVVTLVAGETRGKQIVKAADAALLNDFAEQAALIHSVLPDRLSFLRERDEVARLAAEFATVDGTHPVVDLALWWLAETRPPPLPVVVAHGDYRVGNVVVGDGRVRGRVPGRGVGSC